MKNADALEIVSPAFARPLHAASIAPASKRPSWATQRVEQRIIESLVADDTKLLRELARRGVSEASVRAHARTLGMTWEFIKQCRLSGSRPAMRVCINCDVRFLSSGMGIALAQSTSARWSALASSSS